MAEVEAFVSQPLDALMPRTQTRRSNVGPRGAGAGTSTVRDLSPRDLAFLRRWLKMVECQHGDARTSVMTLAQSMCLSQRQLFNKVKALTGMSPHAFLTEYRVERAKKLLRTRPLSVTQVAEKTGFGSGSAFSKCFRKTVGTTPSRYRQTRCHRLAVAHDRILTLAAVDGTAPAP